MAGLKPGLPVARLRRIALDLSAALQLVPGVSPVGSTSTPPIVGGNTSLFRVVGAPMTPQPYEANSRPQALENAVHDIDPGFVLDPMQTMEFL